MLLLVLEEEPVNAVDVVEDCVKLEIEDAVGEPTDVCDEVFEEAVVAVGTLDLEVAEEKVPSAVEEPGGECEEVALDEPVEVIELSGERVALAQPLSESAAVLLPELDDEPELVGSVVMEAEYVAVAEPLPVIIEDRVAVCEGEAAAEVLRERVSDTVTEPQRDTVTVSDPLRVKLGEEDILTLPLLLGEPLALGEPLSAATVGVAGPSSERVAEGLTGTEGERRVETVRVGVEDGDAEPSGPVRDMVLD